MKYQKEKMYQVTYQDTNGKLEAALFTTKPCAELFAADCKERGIKTYMHKQKMIIYIED